MRAEHWFYTLPLRLRSLFRRRAVDAELEEELRYHLDQRAHELEAAGVDPEEARRTAMREMGGLTQRIEECRDARRVAFVEDFLHDVRFAIRQFRRHPGFAAAAVLTLALGIGAATSMFSVVNALLLRPLPFADPNRLVMLSSTGASADWQGPVSFPNYSDWKRLARSFEGMAAWSSYVGLRMNLTGSGAPEQVQYALVTHDLFATLGVRPAIGRPFEASDDRPGGRRVVVVSHQLWTRSFGADPSLVGRNISLDGAAYTVIGVMPQGFAFTRFPRDADLWLPVGLDPAMPVPGRGRMFARPVEYLGVVGRLEPGVSLAEAQAEMDAIGRQLQVYRENAGKGVRLVGIAAASTRGLRAPLWYLLGGVAFVLLIGCANVANLMLARGTSRRREFALRAALGARSGRLVRQLLTESLLIGSLAGAAGIVLARWGTTLLAQFPYNAVSFSSPYYTASDRIAIDWTVAAFALALSVVTPLLFGAAPAREARRADVTTAVRPGAAATPRARRLRDGLVVGEVALALVLLTGAGLLLKTLAHLQAVDPGFDTANALTLEVSLPQAKYGEPSKIAIFYEELLARARTLPGVRDVAATTVVPLSGGDEGSDFSVEGTPVPPPGHDNIAATRSVSAGYFASMGIPLIAGRAFTAADRPGAARVAIVNQTLARRFWPGGDAVGKRLALHVEALRFGPRPGPPVLDRDSAWREVVGVIADIHTGSLSDAARAEVYVPYLQAPTRDINLVVRTAGEPESIANALRREVLRIDKDQPISGVRTLSQLMSASVARPRFNALLSTLFSGLALLLAASGLYAVVAYSTSQRTGEFGVRMALGAGRRDVLALALVSGARSVSFGVAIGLVTSALADHLLGAFLYGVGPLDVQVLAGAALLLFAVGLAACYFPARRAAFADPLRALRHE